MKCSMDQEFLRKQRSFRENPHINPDNGKRLIHGKGPYNQFVDKYGDPAKSAKTSPTPVKQSSPEKPASKITQTMDAILPLGDSIDESIILHIDDFETLNNLHATVTTIFGKLLIPVHLFNHSKYL